MYDQLVFLPQGGRVMYVTSVVPKNKWEGIRILNSDYHISLHTDNISLIAQAVLGAQ